MPAFLSYSLSDNSCNLLFNDKTTLRHRTISEDGTIQRTPLIATLPQMDGSYLSLESEGYIGIVDRRVWEENSEQILADIAPVAVVIKVRLPFGL